MDIWILTPRIDDVKDMAEIKALHDLPLERRNQMNPASFNKLKKSI